MTLKEFLAHARGISHGYIDVAAEVASSADGVEMPTVYRVWIGVHQILAEGSSPEAALSEARAKVAAFLPPDKKNDMEIKEEATNGTNRNGG